MGNEEFGYSRPALLLGFVLGNLFEHYLFLSLAVAGPVFFARAISLFLILLTVGVVGYEPIKKLLGHRFGKGVRKDWNKEVVSTS